MKLLTFQNWQDYLYSLGFKRFSITTSLARPFVIEVYIDHFWFNKNKLGKMIECNKPIGIVVEINKLSFWKWLSKLFSLNRDRFKKVNRRMK